MWSFHLWGVPCRVSLLFPALLTALMLCQPENMAVTCLLASVIHEGGHLLAMLLLKVPPEDCVLGVFGLRIRLGSRLAGYKKYLWIALAGPLANGIAALCLWTAGCPQAAMIHVVLAALNLLPIAVLDGGEMVRCILYILLGADERASTITKCISLLMLFSLCLCGLWLYWRQRGNPALLIVCAYLAVTLFFSEKNEKTS